MRCLSHQWYGLGEEGLYLWSQRDYSFHLIHDTNTKNHSTIIHIMGNPLTVWSGAFSSERRTTVWTPQCIHMYIISGGHLEVNSRYLRIRWISHHDWLNMANALTHFLRTSLEQKHWNATTNVSNILYFLHVYCNNWMNWLCCFYLWLVCYQKINVFVKCEKVDILP